MLILVEILYMIMYVLLLCTYVLIVITEKYAIIMLSSLFTYGDTDTNICLRLMYAHTCTS